MVEIKDREDLERWLENRPLEDAITIAARAALRVVPLLVTALDKNAEARRGSIVLPTFRAMAAPWVAAVEPTHGAEVQKAFDANALASDAASNAAALPATNANAATFVTYAADNVAFVALNALNAANASNASNAALNAATNAATAADNSSNAAAAIAAHADVWEAVNADATALEQDEAPEQVAATTLWPQDPPGWAMDAWASLKDHLLAADEGWQAWTGWYEDRLHGRPFNKALEEARILIDVDLWD